MKTGYKKTKNIKAGYLGDSPMEMKPMVSLDSSMLPEIKKWKVGSTYKVTLELKQTGLHQRSDDKLCGDFEVTSAKEA